MSYQPDFRITPAVLGRAEAIAAVRERILIFLRDVNEDRQEVGRHRVTVNPGGATHSGLAAAGR